MIIGCAAIQTLESPKEPNPRIVYRDLTKPKAFYPVPKEGAFGTQTPANAARKEAIVFYIEFDNDSFKNFDEMQLKPLVAITASNANVLVIGHSHGRSAVGTLALAARRAETIQRYLEGVGITNVHTMAFWGTQETSFAPSRGVQVYVLPEGEIGKTLPVVLARQERGVPNEGPKEDSVVSCGTTDSNSVKAGLDNV
jgi:hypothetical protein